MNVDDGSLSFGTAIDMSGFDEGAAHIEQKVSEIGDKAEAESARISELLTNVPDVNIDVITNASESLAVIQQGFDEIDRVVDTNKAAISDLEKEYATLSDKIKTASRKGDSGEVKRLKEEKRAIQENIAIRKKVNDEAAKTADALAATERQLKKEAEEAAKNASKHENLRTKIRELKLELVEMEAAGQRNTAKYKEIQEEVGRLTDAWGDATVQASILAHDQRGMQGLISGLSGVSGAMSAAQGAVALFAGENEDLQKIMLKVQSLMAITMGLQQLQAALDKDSAFRLVTLNGLKEIWNKLIGNSAEVIEDENAALKENAASQELDAAATNTDTAAQTKNNTSTVAGTAAQVANTAATKSATAATVAGTIATRAASIALKGLKAALISTGIGAIIVLVGELVGWLVSLFDTISETEKRQEELNEVMDEGAKAYGKAQAEISGYITKIDKFNGSKKQEKELVKELNSKYGEALGYYDSLSKWKEVLITKGEAYCTMLLKEAEAQAILNKYTEAFIALEEARNKKASDYGHWYTTKAGDEQRKKEAVADAQATADYWMQAYKDKMAEAQDVKIDFNIGGNTDPKSGNKGGGKSGSDFDPKKAALETQKAIDDYKDKVKKYLKGANDEVSQLIIDSQEEGLVKELNVSRSATRRRLEDWENQLRQLAEQRKAMLKAVYMQQKGATEVGWSESDAGKKSIEQYRKDLLADENISKEYYRVRQQITENGENEIMLIRQKYDDMLIEQYGTNLQKQELLYRKWMNKMKFLPAEYVAEATRQMDEEFAKLSSENFKEIIDWDSVFGSLDKQSIQSLQINLERVKKYFEENKESMDGKEIKEYTDAIKQMEDEIASRNPFAAMHKSIKDMSASKTELVNALKELSTAQNELNAAEEAYKNAMQEQRDAIDAVERGELAQDCQQQTDAANKLREATERLADAQKKNAQAENNVIKSRNNLTQSYKSFAQNLKNAGGVIKDVGGKAKNLAQVFSDDLADGIGKGLDFIDDILGAASDVINAVSDVGKSAAKGIESTVDAAAQGATASAAAGATAISTIEKASVILAVISAALQVATVIANLFNDDDEKQEKIERLQQRIDQLQWELDNRDVVRLQEKYGDAVAKVRDIYNETLNACYALHQEEMNGADIITKIRTRMIAQNEAYQKSIEKIADYWANIDYTANRALGSVKYDEARDKLKNMAEQQLLIQQQINAEKDKKHTDWGSVSDMEDKIRELAGEMADLINELMDDIIGSTAEDLAQTLGDAFFDAVAQGEEAMEAWHQKVNEIVRDILKRMLITQYLEPKIGEIFDKYRNRWFKNGQFQGIEVVRNSANDFANDLNQAGEMFSGMFSALDEATKNLLEDTAERQGESRGIATASQESVDENNARLTTIQGHTYSLVQGMGELNATSNQILARVTGIERNTDETNNKLDNMNSRIRRIESSVDEIQTKGITIKV